MRAVFVASDNIFSPIGSTTEENMANLEKNISGVQRHDVNSMSPVPFYASLFNQQLFPDTTGKYTKFEQLLIQSIKGALKGCDIDPANPRTILIISTTKGNISLLEEGNLTAATKEKIAVSSSASLVAGYFGFIHTPIIVSNACISGMLAILTGMRILQSGKYDHAIVVGADAISKFILSGFQSFQAVSDDICKPFDAGRKGINLGEGAATVILSADTKYKNNIRITGGAVSNDANHISGPSRTGEELCLAINKTLKEAGIKNNEIDFISAHGTATLYNDEMEAKAITLAGMQKVPVNSLKGFYGHTLGAAGIIESIIAMQSIKKGVLLPTKGFEQLGVPVTINVAAAKKSATIKNVLKTASGFGGCNAALLMQQ